MKACNPITYNPVYVQLIKSKVLCLDRGIALLPIPLVADANRNEASEARAGTGPHMLRVWNIYLLLPHKFMVNVPNIPYMDPMGYRMGFLSFDLRLFDVCMEKVNQHICFP